MSEPINLILFCPVCGLQHVDAPAPELDWDNPPHRSHLCARCGTIWRPCDLPTTGVAAIGTRGSLDSWPPTARDGDYDVVPAVQKED